MELILIGAFLIIIDIALLRAAWRRVISWRSKPKQNPMPTGATPVALRICSFLRRASHYTFFASIVLINLVILSAPVFYPFFAVLGYVVCLAFGLTLLLVALRYVVILFFIARYSLLQMLGAIITANILVVLIIKLDGFWKIFPSWVLICFVLFVIYYIQAQDPEGLGHTPGFIREYLNKKQTPPE